MGNKFLYDLCVTSMVDCVTSWFDKIQNVSVLLMMHSSSEIYQVIL